MTGLSPSSSTSRLRLALCVSQHVPFKRRQKVFRHRRVFDDTDEPDELVAGTLRDDVVDANDDDDDDDDDISSDAIINDDEQSSDCVSKHFSSRTASVNPM